MSKIGIQKRQVKCPNIKQIFNEFKSRVSRYSKYCFSAHFKFSDMKKYGYMKFISSPFASQFSHQNLYKNVLHIKRNEQCCSWNPSVCIIVFANSAVRSKFFFFSHFVKYFNVLGLKILPNQTWILFSLKRYFLRIDVLMWLIKVSMQI